MRWGQHSRQLERYLFLKTSGGSVDQADVAGTACCTGLSACRSCPLLPAGGFVKCHLLSILVPLGSGWCRRACT